MQNDQKISFSDMLGSVFSSLIASFIFGIGSKVYEYIQENKPFEEKLKDAFERAVRKYFKDKLQQEKVIYSKANEYIAKYKAELDGETDVFESEKYKKLYSYFKHEIYTSPYLWKDCLFTYIRLGRKELRQNAEDIKNLVNAKANEIIQYQRQTQELLQQFVSCTSLPFFSIQDSPESRPLPDHISMRTELVSELSGALGEHRILIIYGTKLSGKSVLAQLVAERYNTYYSIDCRRAAALRDIRFSLLNYKLSFPSHELIILDNLANESLEDVLRELTKEDNSTKYIITTIEKYDTGISSNQTLGIYQIEAPLLTAEETREIVATYNPKFDLDEIVSFCSRQHPLLVHAICEYMQTQNWEFDRKVLSDLLKGVSLDNLHDFIGKRILKEIPDDETRHLLNRLLVVTTTFTERDVEKLAEVEPQISQPLSRFMQIKPLWVTQNKDGEYTFTPVLGLVWKPDLLDAEKKACNKYLAESILAKKDLTELEAVLAIMYFQNAGMEDYAGQMYIHILEYYGNQLSAQSLLSNMWVGISLPLGMSVGMKYVVRITQWVRLQAISGTMKALVYDDLKRIMDTEGETIQNSAIAYQIMSSISIINSDVNASLRYYKKSRELGADAPVDLVDEYAALLSEFRNAGIWVMLAHIDDTEKYENWLELYQESSPVTHEYQEIEYASCFAFAWQFVDAQNDILGQSKVEVLDTILAKALECNVDSLAITLAYKKMVLSMIDSNIGQAEEVYEEYIARYSENSLAKFLLNDAMGAAYYEAEGYNKKCLEYFNKANSLTDKLILPDLQLHALERVSFIQSSTDKQAALESLTLAYEYALRPECHIAKQELYFLKGEIAQAKWLAGDQVGSIRELSECVAFALQEVQTSSPFAKTYLCKCNCMINLYLAELNGEQLAVDQIAPTPGMFIQEEYNKYDEAYTEQRRVVSAVQMFTLCEILQIEEWEEKWARKTIEICKHDEMTVKGSMFVQNLYPYLIKHNDMENALYVSKLTLGAFKIATEAENREFDQAHWVLVYQVYPLLLLSLTKYILENDTTTYEQIKRILCMDVIDKSNAVIQDAKDIFEIPINDIDSQYMGKYILRSKYPLSIVIQLIFLLKEEQMPNAFNTICYALQSIQKESRALYKQSMDELFDDFVFAYWQWKMATSPEKFSGKDHFMQHGADVSGFPTNKAKKYMNRLHNHIKNIDLTPKQFDWLCDDD